MARKKRRTAKRKIGRSRRVSGISDIDFTSIALIVGGAVVGRILYTKLTASTNATMVKFAPYIGFAAGIVLPMVSKSPMLKSLGMGLVASGGVNMLVGLKVISGIEQTVGMHRVGYPYNVIPYQKRIAGFVDGSGTYVSKPNFSGSRQSQMNVIGKVAGHGMSTGAGGGTLY